MNIDSNSLKSLYIECCFCTDENEEILATATGFIIKKKDKYFLITNRHVVTGRDLFTNEVLDKITGAVPNLLKVYINNEVIEKDKTSVWLNESFVDLYLDNEIYDDHKLWLEHPIYKDLIDVVAIDITRQCKIREKMLCSFPNRIKVNTYSYILEDNNYIPKVTDEVSIVGYPFSYPTTSSDGYYPIWCRGTIASEYNKSLVVPMDAIIRGSNYIKADAFLVDSRSRKGQSGSPVIMKRKNKTILLGIYSGRTNNESDLGYVWKTKLIKEIIEDV